LKRIFNYGYLDFCHLGAGTGNIETARPGIGTVKANTNKQQYAMMEMLKQWKNLLARIGFSRKRLRKQNNAVGHVVFFI